jgi:hypothetical protein
MVWVDFDRWSKSTTPANTQHLRISRGQRSITTMDGLAVNQTLGGIRHSSAKLAQQHLLNNTGPTTPIAQYTR